MSHMDVTCKRKRSRSPVDIDPASVTEEIAAQVTGVQVTPDPPDDFDAFWQNTLEELNDVPLDLKLEMLEGENASETTTRAYWSANSLDGRRIGGPVTFPPEVKGPQWVYGHGYGSVQQGCAWQDRIAAAGFIAVGVDARGYHRSRLPHDPEVPGWAIHGIASKETYILRGAVADTIRAVQVARSLAGADPKRTVLAGGSFSGGLATLAAPWIADLVYLALRVPTFGAYDLRRHLVQRGSGAEVNTYMDSLQPDEQRALRDRLRYFDAVNAATRIHDVPATVGLGVSDVVVPGETVAAIYHALATNDKELLWYPCSHAVHPLTARWAEFETHTLERGMALCGL